MNSYFTVRVLFLNEIKFNKDFKNGIFNAEVRDLIEYWVTEIEDLGYKEYIKSELFKMLNDHSLKNERHGQHSITLDQTGGRLIYSIVKNAIVIKVIKITSYSLAFFILPYFDI